MAKITPWPTFASGGIRGVFERGNYDQWQAAGGQSLAERAVDRVVKILEDHEPELLPQDLARAVHSVVERAEESFA